MVIDISRSVLVMIDVQNDFCPGHTRSDGNVIPPGNLAVSDGNAVVSPLNRLAYRFHNEGGRVVATQDWHPAGHVSFASAHPGTSVYDTLTIALPEYRQGLQNPPRSGDVPPPSAIDQTLWPDHCVQATPGAGFHPDLNLNLVHLVLRKGYHANLDSYSAFYENDRRTPTGLDGWLRNLGVGTLFLGGLATDFCVMYSALDAVRHGYETVLLLDASRGVDLPRGSVDRSLALMRGSGVHFMESGDLA